MAEEMKAQLMETIAQTANGVAKSLKVTVVGSGQVGMACVFSILNSGCCTELALVDINADKVRGELLDLQHGSQFLKPCKLVAGTDYSISAGSDLVVITAGVRQNIGESRLNLVERNVKVFKHIIGGVVKYSPNSTLLIASNPCDIMTWVAWKLSGFPHHRVIGSGTTLDSARFRFLVAQKLGVATSSVHAMIIGEHGDSSVAVWSGVNVAGLRLAEAEPGYSDKVPFNTLHDEVVQSAYEVIRLKGYTNWAIGLSVGQLAQAILLNQKTIHPVSVLAKGFHGIEHEVFLSLPASLGRHGVREVVKNRLSKVELERLHSCADNLAGISTKLVLNMEKSKL